MPINQLTNQLLTCGERGRSHQLTHLPKLTKLQPACGQRSRACLGEAFGRRRETEIHSLNDILYTIYDARKD